MKKRIMFYFMWLALFIFVGNSFAMEEKGKTLETVTTQEKIKGIGETGIEGVDGTAYGIGAGNAITTQ